MLIFRMCAVENTGFNIFLCFRCSSPLNQSQDILVAEITRNLIPKLPISPGPKTEPAALEGRCQHSMIHSLLRQQLTEQMTRSVHKHLGAKPMRILSYGERRPEGEKTYFDNHVVQRFRIEDIELIFLRLG